MNNYNLLNRLGGFIAELTAFYRDISQELPQLQFVDVKKRLKRRLFQQTAAPMSETMTI
jgi:hypothetical protein